MQTSMTIATLLALLCSANAATLVRERTQQLHKSAAASSGARLWTEEEDPFRRLQTTVEEGSYSVSMSMSQPVTNESMSYPEVEEIPNVDQPGAESAGDKEAAAESGAMTVGTTVSALAAAGAMMFL